MKLFRDLKRKRDRHFAKLKLREAQLKTITNLVEIGISEARIKKYFNWAEAGQSGVQRLIEDLYQRVDNFDRRRKAFFELQLALQAAIHAREELNALK